MRHKKYKKVNLKNTHCYFCLKERGLDESDAPFLTPSQGLEHHHVFGGANRKLSEEYGLVIMLCPLHHRNGAHAVHNDYEMNLELKMLAQREFEKLNSRESFIELFGRNYL